MTTPDQNDAHRSWQQAWQKLNMLTEPYATTDPANSLAMTEDRFAQIQEARSQERIAWQALKQARGY